MAGQSGEDGFLSLRETLPGEEGHKESKSSRVRAGLEDFLKYVRLLLIAVLLPSVLTEVA